MLVYLEIPGPMDFLFSAFGTARVRQAEPTP
mgnify:CR=1 FL=1